MDLSTNLSSPASCTVINAAHLFAQRRLPIGAHVFHQHAMQLGTGVVVAVDGFDRWIKFCDGLDEPVNIPSWLPHVSRENDESAPENTGGKLMKFHLRDLRMVS